MGVGELMATKSICLNRGETEVIKKIKSQVIKLHSSPSTRKLKEVFGTLDFLEKKITSNFENQELVENSRNLDEVAIHLNLTRELLWYYDLLANKSKYFDDNNPKLNMSKEEQEEAKRIASKFDIQDQHINEYTHGLLKGKSIAFGWILGEAEWDDLHS